jgi:hypothetical protein
MGKKNFIKYSVGFIILTFLLGCDPADGKLTLVNSSEDTVYYSVELCEDSIRSFPITYKEGKIDTLFSNILLKGEKQGIPVMDTWEETINGKCKDSTLRIFFFSKDLIQSAGEDSIMKHQLYSKRKKLKVKDLEKLNWRVVYKEQ